MSLYLHWDDVAPYFHTTLANAASRLRVSESSLKIWRREYGIDKWPYRTIRGLKTQLRVERSKKRPNKSRIRKLNQNLESIFRPREPSRKRWRERTPDEEWSDDEEPQSSPGRADHSMICLCAHVEVPPSQFDDDSVFIDGIPLGMETVMW